MAQRNADSESSIADSGQPCASTVIRAVQAWITEGDGDWGFDEVYHLQIEYADGRKVHLTDAMPDTATAFFETTSMLEHKLGLKIAWTGAILVEYLRYKKQPWWAKILTGWHHNKRTVYPRQEEVNDK